MYLLLIILTIVTTGTTLKQKEKTKTYPVKKTSKHLAPPGNGNDPEWKKASRLTDFQFPWEDLQPHPTSFQALHDDEWLYCFFDVSDPAIHITVDTNEKVEVAASSRAEIFFKADDAMSPYYCLEIDPNARVLDYKAFYHRKFDFSWSWPAGELLVKSRRRADGYSIELAISKRSLRQLGLLNNNSLQAGIYRADCARQPGKEPEFKWISWIMPDSKTPDFHIPSSFGLLRLEE